MREINKEFEVIKSVTENVTAIVERIVTIEENKLNRTVTVRTEYLDAELNVIAHDSYLISESNYGLLMSESPSFAPNKPQNEYREDDIWYIIDLIQRS